MNVAILTRKVAVGVFLGNTAFAVVAAFVVAIIRP